MSGIGSLGLDSTLRCFMQGTKYCHRYWWHPRELLFISTAPHCTNKLQELKKKQQPKNSLSLLVDQLRAHYYCTTTILLLLYGLYVLPTMLRYDEREIRKFLRNFEIIVFV